MTGIYKIENKINQKVYIGQSINIEKRWVAHKNTASNKYSLSYDYPLYRAIRKYGLKNFEFSVIEECNILSLNEREIYWIDYYNSSNKNFGYNLTLGGSHSSAISLTLGNVEEIIKLLSETTMSQEEIGLLYNVSQRTVSSINLGETWRRNNVSYPIRDNKRNGNIFPHGKVNVCPDCGEIICFESSYCQQCASLHQRKVNRPSKEVLKKEIRDYSFLSLGKKYGVSDNSIRKWCEAYGLPKKKQDIKKYSDEDWEKL